MRIICCFIVVLSCYVIYVSGFSIRHVFGNKGIGTSEGSVVRRRELEPSSELDVISKRDSASPGETYIFGHSGKRSAGGGLMDMLDTRPDMDLTEAEDDVDDLGIHGLTTQDRRYRSPTFEEEQSPQRPVSRLLDEFMTFLTLKEQGLLDMCLKKKR